MTRFKLIPSYHKVFENQSFDAFAPLADRKSALKGETFYFAGVLETDETTLCAAIDCAFPAKAFAAESVYIRMPVYERCVDNDYLSKEPGRFPDVLRDLTEAPYTLPKGILQGLWFALSVPADAKAGDADVTVCLKNGDGEEIARAKTVLHVIDAVLPEQKLWYTEWFHCDCLSSYYCVDPLSEAHWELIETYAKTAVENGQNMLYMPVFTPSLDTAKGGERPTVQLVRITKNGDRYDFDFRLVDRWLAMCERIGIRYHEIAHLFSQWGAAYAPKIMAVENGETKRIFGWETDSLSDEYIGFLKQFLSAFKAYMAGKGLLDKCLFHLSDEPVPEHLPRYLALREKLADELDGLRCGEALSNYEFYKTGAVGTPIVGTDAIGPFLENKVPGLWAYYCCGEFEKVSNRFIAMSMNRTRVIAAQLFKYDIAGFLQWGYNFWYCGGSKHMIDPYVTFDGLNGWVPAGDACSVYPGEDGRPVESLHLKAFTQGLQDLRAFELLASLIGKDAVVEALEEDGVIRFDEFCRDADWCERTRDKINGMIENALA